MKKFYVLSFAVLLAFGCLHANKIRPVDKQIFKTFNKSITSKKAKVKEKFKTSSTRSIESPETDFEASEAGFFYYESLFASGNDAYWLILSNSGIDTEGLPQEEGQMLRLLLVSDPYYTDQENLKIPVGVYEFSEEDKPFTISPYASNLLDVFFDPENPESGELFGYIFEIEDGTLTVAENDGVYDIVSDLTVVLYDEEGNEIDRQTSHVTFTGEIPYYEEDHSYPPLENDVVMDIPNLSGNYMEGDYSLTFYGTELDEDGFLIGGGDLFNVELFTPEVAPMNPDDLIGEYTVWDGFNYGPNPGYFMEGVWYELFGGIYVPGGTSLSIYDDNLNMIALGLAIGGTVKVSKIGNEFKFDFDLITAEEKKMTGSWQGILEDYVVDFSDSHVGSIEDDVKIYGEHGFVVAPENAEIFTIDGQRLRNENLMPGIYIVKTSKKIAKVLVK